MKLNELAVTSPIKQAAKVFESYFGNSINFEQLTQSQARGMLNRVRSLIAEHRRTPGFHRSEQSPAYLKLVVMEQALSATAATTTTAGAPQQTPQQAQAAMTLARQQKQRAIDDELKQLQAQEQEITKKRADLQKQKGMLESRIARRLREASEVQQAQVVLASQDMVDQVQKMSEQVSAMQFKDLPALVDQIKNEVGVDQASQFNGDASAALSGLLQNLQGAKQQLEAALGVVTGQAPQVPGADMATDLGADLGAEELPAELPAPGEEEVDVNAEIEEPAGTLGRARR
jgi:flagellar biosynthesis GTPase FlhF